MFPALFLAYSRGSVNWSNVEFDPIDASLACSFFSIFLPLLPLLSSRRPPVRPALSREPPYLRCGEHGSEGIFSKIVGNFGVPEVWYRSSACSTPPLVPINDFLESPSFERSRAQATNRLLWPFPNRRANCTLARVHLAT